MKTLITRNGFLFLLLMAGLTFNILWSARLESTAQDISAKVTEHHGMLSQNKDILSALSAFMRAVPPYSINMDDKTINLQGLDARIKIGADKTGGGIIQLKAGEKHAVTLDKQEGIGLQSLNKPILLTAGPNFGEISFKIDPEKQRIYIKTGDNYGIGIGKSGDLGRWISLKLGDTKAITLAENKGVGLNSDDKPVEILGKKSLEIDFEGDINISSKGNINIRSEKGNVKINGKRIDLNE